ncbi:hypothetical protein D9615_007651 [Tricholomella constricta]|uniref:OTU domain-containing protein n=1 Tax=Tricholomella constricta TaxID=117010 RepID=A0A8H5H3V9_9AGAR|nr:hypothetical protein D9615_007651 [Tricholomella constricta]
MGSARKNNKAKAPPQLRSRTTRSSKGRLLTASDPAASTALLSSQLRALGLYAADTLGDGNCLFRALSDQLYGSPSRHMDLRQEICDWIAKHRERYEPFVEDERGLETHLRCMREHGTYGGHMELSAFSHFTRRNVKVIQPGLVYVIEWAAFASPPTSPIKASHSYLYHNEYDDGDDDDGEEDVDEGEEDDEEEDGQLNERERRRLRRERVRDAKERKGKKVKEKEKPASKKDRNPTSSPPPPPVNHIVTEPAEIDTIYVAYHDWEHFSSIRNLRGPHTGLPTVRETPPPLLSAPPPPSSAKTKEQGAKRKVTLKLGSGSGTTTPVPPAIPDPTAIPLPTSRAASPFPPAPPSTSTDASAGASGSASLAPHPLRASHVLAEPHSTHLHAPPFPHPHPNHLDAHARTVPSPKRALDTAGDDSECSAASSGSKRSRTSRTTHTSTPRHTHTMDVDVDIDTPSLSPPSSTASTTTTSTTSTSSTTTSASSVPDIDVDADAGPDTPASSTSTSPEPEPASSPEPSPEPGSELERPDNHLLPVIAQEEEREKDRPMTRRQRKALGLPKLRGAGKIVIPGGRFKRGVRVGVEEEKEREGEGEGEWTKNGTGRVDVRGFRELRI